MLRFLATRLARAALTIAMVVTFGNTDSGIFDT